MPDAKKDFNSKKDGPNSREESLITKIQDAIKAYEYYFYDPREPDETGSYMFKTEGGKTFLKLADELAQLIETQGAANTYPPLVNVARKLKQAGADKWEGGYDLGHAFKDGLGKEAKPNKNPFLKFKL